jgi:uncharacterized protein YjdB/protocatechuate 3,4-dioxygenase beta subunit
LINLMFWRKQCGKKALSVILIILMLMGMLPPVATAAAPTTDISVTGVTITPETATIEAGGTVQLAAEVLPVDATNKSVTWASDKPDIATVDASGLVTAVAAGTAKITATTADGGFTATGIITVEVPPPPPVVRVTGVTVAPDVATIEVGASAQLDAEVLPVDAANQAVTWTSSDEAVATVSDTGLVTAVAAGTATITVTTTVGEFTATGTITVAAAEIRAEPEKERLFPRWLDRERLSPEQPAVGGFGVQAIGTGTVSGTVTDTNGNPVIWAYVVLWDAETATYEWAQTDETGKYTITGLPAGSYKMWITPAGGEYLAQAYFPTVDIVAGDNTIDVTLQAGGLIAGQVTDTGQNPVAGAEIYVRDPHTGATGWAWTDENGNFMTTGLPAGSYEMDIYPPEGSNLLAASFTGIDVYVNQTTTLYPITLQRGGTITGQVTDADGAPVEGASINVWDSETQNHHGSATTDKGGNYTIIGLPTGTYNLEVQSPHGAYLLSASFTDLEVFSGATTTQNVTLEAGGLIAGKVIDPAGKPVADAYVIVWDPDTDAYGWAWTDKDGNFITTGLPAGSYEMDIYPPEGANLVRAYITGLGVIVGRTTTRNVTLRHGGTITGRVTNIFGNPVEGAYLRVWDPVSETSGSATTDEDGNYTITGLPAGTYEMDVYPPTGAYLVRAFIPGLRVIVGLTTTRNVTLQAGGLIAGQVTDPYGNPVADAEIYVWDPDTEADDRAWTDVDGYFMTTGMPAGTYEMDIYPPEGVNLVPAFITGIVVTVDITTTRNVTLQHGGTITGQVTDTDGNPVEGASINVWDSETWDHHGSATTDEDGNYTITGLPAGTYDLRATPPTGTYLVRVFITGLGVIVDQTTTQNVTLEAGGLIEGWVTGPDGTTVEGAEIYVWDPDNDTDDWTWTDEDGNFLTTGLPAGIYSLLITPPEGSNLSPALIQDLVVVVGESTSTGDIKLAKFNDNFADRTPLSGLSGLQAGYTGEATKERGEPNHGGNRGGRSVWFEWRAPFSGTVEFGTHGSGFDTLLAVYTGTRVGALRRVAQNNNYDDENTSLVSFRVRAGTIYRIAVDGFNATTTPANADSGWFNLTWGYIEIPATRVTLNQTSLTLKAGEEYTLVATITPAEAFSFDREVSWSSSNPAVATVDEHGLVAAVGPGRADITVTSADGGRRAVCRVTVPGLALTPQNTSVEVGRRVNLRAVLYAERARTDVTARAVWSSNNEEVATVSRGRVLGVDADDGPVTITVSFDVDGGTLEASASVIVVPLLRRLEAKFTTLPLEINSEHDPIQITAHYRDGTFEEVTALCAWSSSRPLVASVDDEGRIIAGDKPGRTTISAVLGSRRVNIIVNVIPVVTDLELERKTLQIEAGLTANIRVRAEYAGEDDFHRANIAPKAIWESSDPALVTVTGGRVRAVAPGEATLTVTFGSQSMEIPVEVIPRLRKITVLDASHELNVYDTLTVPVTAVYRDSVSFPDEEVTDRVTWSSSRPAIAEVDEYGLITAVSPGPTTISAVYGSRRINIIVIVAKGLD